MVAEENKLLFDRLLFLYEAETIKVTNQAKNLKAEKCNESKFKMD